MRHRIQCDRCTGVQVCCKLGVHSHFTETPRQHSTSGVNILFNHLIRKNIYLVHLIFMWMIDFLLSSSNFVTNIAYINSSFKIFSDKNLIWEKGLRIISNKWSNHQVTNQRLKFTAHMNFETILSELDLQPTVIGQVVDLFETKFFLNVTNPIHTWKLLLNVWYKSMLPIPH